MRRLTALLTLVVFLAIGLSAADSAAQFYYRETGNLRLVYFGQAHSFLVSHTARCFENSLRFHCNLFSYTPSEKVTVLLHDLSDYGNGGASTSPRNRISLGIAPISYAYETIPANERVNATLNHELVHILAADKCSGRDRAFRTIFGGKVPVSSANPLTALYNYLTLPRRSAPVWYHEGIAVFMETWMGGGMGRALGAYDEMVFRTMVRDSSRFYLIQGLEAEGLTVDFHVGVNSYLYGTRFMTYLAYQYGPEKLVEWVSRSNGSCAYYAAQFQHVYQMSLDAAWRDWIAFEKGFQSANLARLREYPITPVRPIGKRALGSVSQGYYNGSDSILYCAVNYPGEVAHLAAIDIRDGASRKVCDIKGAAIFFVTSLTYDPSSRTLFYTTDNDGWRDLVEVDARSGKSRVLLKDARIGDLVFNAIDRSIWGVRHFNGISALVRIPYPYEAWNLVYDFPYGKDIYDISLSPDGTMLAGSLSEISGRQSLIAMDVERLLRGDSTYTTLYDFGNTIPANFTFSPDGGYLYGASYYTGVSNIFRYHIEADSMDAVSNCETGLFRPIVLSNDSLIAFQYSGKGFQPVVIPNRVLEDVNPISYLGQRLVEAYPALKEWNVGPPSQIDLDTLFLDSGQYHEWSHMGLSSGYPVVEGYRDGVAWGSELNFSGPLELDRINVSLSYSPQGWLPTEERLHARLRYSHSDWTVTATQNRADFYDLFGPTKTSRKGYSVGLSWQKSLYFDPPKSVGLSAFVTHYGDLVRLPEYQNIVSSYDRFVAFGLRLGYANQRASLGAVDYEKGISWQLQSSNRYVNRILFPRYVGVLNVGAPIGPHHASIWLRGSAGYAHGDHFQPLANFYFGGFGNNWVDQGDVKRYRSYESFPGAEINEIAGTNFVKGMVELNLPPLRFRSLGIPSFYVSWARTALFASALRTNLDLEREGETAYNAGGQVDFRIVMLSHYQFTCSIGYAARFAPGTSKADELMVSLKVL